MLTKYHPQFIKLFMQISITEIVITIKRLKCAKTIFDSCGLSYIWNYQYYVGSKSMLVNAIDKNVNVLPPMTMTMTMTNIY